MTRQKGTHPQRTQGRRLWSMCGAQQDAPKKERKVGGRVPRPYLVPCAAQICVQQVYDSAFGVLQHRLSTLPRARDVRGTVAQESRLLNCFERLIGGSGRVPIPRHAGASLVCCASLWQPALKRTDRQRRHHQLQRHRDGGACTLLLGSVSLRTAIRRGQGPPCCN